MNVKSKKKIVVLGMISKMPVAGCAWLTLHYLLGFRHLGHNVYYVESHGMVPSMMTQGADDDASMRAASYIDGIMRRFDLGNNWAFVAEHDDRRCYGLTELELANLYREADVIINLHGATVPLPEHARTGRLVYLETDPVELEIELFDGKEEAFRFLEPHVCFFTWAENYGSADCEVPLPAQFPFRPTRPPVIVDMWQNDHPCGGDTFTTVGSWKQLGRDIVFRKKIYRWSKHYEYLKFIDLPRTSGQQFELALSKCDEADLRMLDEHGWMVRPALPFTIDLDEYRDYVRASRGEFTVAKEQNVRLKSGWFSDRSVEYLAAGRPVITQETGFSNTLPTGRGLFGFSTMDDILAAVDSINSDYEGHCRAAGEIAREYFDADIVLKRLLDEIGL